MVEWSGPEREAIVAAMVSEAMPPLRQPGDFTLNEYIDALRAQGYEVRSKEPVRNQMDRLVENGELVKLTVWDNDGGVMRMVYRKAVPPG